MCRLCCNYESAQVCKGHFRRKTLQPAPPRTFVYCLVHDPSTEDPRAGAEESFRWGRSSSHWSPCPPSPGGLPVTFRGHHSPCSAIYSKHLARPELNSWVTAHLEKLSRFNFHVKLNSSKVHVQYKGRQF